MRRLLLAISLIWLLPATATAQQNSFGDLGYDLEAAPEAQVEIEGYFRSRSEVLHNLDLNHGETPSGQPLFPRPLGNPDSQTFRHADMRLRTDLRAYSPVGAAAVNLRLDLLDNVGFGSTPEGPPQATTTQRPAETVAIKRAYGEALTPLGLIMIGRMGSHWGLGMLTHGGDGFDDDSGDAADRFAFITPIAGHIWAIAYDVAWSGPQFQRRDGYRTLTQNPDDTARAITVAAMQYRTDDSLARRLRAGRPTLDYGAYFSFRWQDQDTPAHYLPGSNDGTYRDADVMTRGFRAHAVDLWARFIAPWGRLEAEIAMLQAQIDEPSVIPGATFNTPVESRQFGGAFESEFGRPDGRVHVGLDAGFASGDPAPGFGAFPGPFDDPAEPGDLDGPQADPPGDTRIDNFQFHPDFRIDQILFREIIGRITDAAYLRPHVTWRIADAGPGTLRASLATIGSAALESSSPPGQSRPLGIEINPSLTYDSHGNFSARLDHGVLFPLSGFDNLAQDLSAQPAHALRLRIAMGF